MSEEAVLELPEPRPRLVRRERRSQLERRFDAICAWWVTAGARRRERRLRTTVQEIRSQSTALCDLSDAQLHQHTVSLRAELRSCPFEGASVQQGLALACEVASRTAGDGVD